MASEYCITYTYIDGMSHGMGSGTSQISSDDSHWKVSGTTTNTIGQVTRIECTRYFSTVSGGRKITAHCNLIFGSKTIQSDSYTDTADAGTMFTFNWSGSNVTSLTDSQVKGTWTLQAVVEGTSPKDLYWRAYRTTCVVVNFYYYDYNDMVTNSARPSLTSAGITVNGKINGVYLRGQSNISISVKATIDPNYASSLVNNYTLILTRGASQTQIYNRSQSVRGASAAVFNVGTINTIGNVTVNASMRDNVGRTVSATTTFAVTEYQQVEIRCEGGTNGVDRCKKVTDEYGSGDTYVMSSDGELVMLNIGAYVQNISSGSSSVPAEPNIGTFSVTYGRGSTPGTSQTGSKSLGYAYQNEPAKFINDHSTITGTFSATQDYWFRFTLIDSYQITITRDILLGKAETIFNIEPYGVAIGMLSTGTSSNKKFECAYPATFKGGATGINNYVPTGIKPISIDGVESSVTNTGDIWFDGKVIYRYIARFDKLESGENKFRLPKDVDAIVKYAGYVRTESRNIYPISACSSAAEFYIADGSELVITVSEDIQPGAGAIMLEYTEAQKQEVTANV